jgi:hypothetical protein
MFALPSPIPKPPSDVTGKDFYSDTMTQAFPTHQVITTLSAPRKQGDWGLKRPLPLRSTTKSSKAMLRVNAIDSVEQITDYTSGTDHGMTLRKFQALGLPITLRQQSQVGQPFSATQLHIPTPSVFDDEFDFTAIDKKKQDESTDQRWKFSGPWLSGMPQGDFKKWLAKEVRPKRPAFRAFLRERIANEMNEAAKLAAVDKGEEPPAPVEASSITEDQVIAYLRKLRHNRPMLYDMVGKFLDLAPVKPSSAAEEGLAFLKTQGKVLEYRDVKSPWAESGPPVTHPSAGLSYLRTSMYMENHPIYGPQKHHPSVQARVIRPYRSQGNQAAKLGVAGFVVETPVGDSLLNSKTGGKWSYIDPTLVGGAKTWVQPQRATVSSHGKVLMSINDASTETTLVTQELLGEKECLGTPLVQPQLHQPREDAKELRKRYAAGPPAMSSAEDYGLDSKSL